MDPGGDWTAVGFLRPGDKLRSATGATLTVASSKLDPTAQRVYNFEVAGLHSYAVGTLQAWVHNGKSRRRRPPEPQLDPTGKVHGPLPDKPHPSWDLEVAADALMCSINTRKRKRTELGNDFGHARRQAQETKLLEKILDILKLR